MDYLTSLDLPPQQLAQLVQLWEPRPQLSTASDPAAPCEHALDWTTTRHLNICVPSAATTSLQQKTALQKGLAEPSMRRPVSSTGESAFAL